MFETLVEGWDELTFQSEEVIDFGDRLFGVSHVTGHGKLSGIVLDLDLFQVVTRAPACASRRPSSPTD